MVRLYGVDSSCTFRGRPCRYSANARNATGSEASGTPVTRRQGTPLNQRTTETRLFRQPTSGERAHRALATYRGASTLL